MKKQMNEKMTGFRRWKSGKRWLYGASILLVLAGTTGLILPSLLQPQIVYAVTNGNVTTNQGILMNTGAVEAGNPQGRVYCIDEGTLLEAGAVAGLSDTGSGAAGVTWASLSATQRAQVQTIGWLSFNNSETSAAGDTNMYLAAQCLVWDVTTGHGLPATSSQSDYNPSHLGEGGDQAWYEATPGYVPDVMMKDMDFLLAQYQKATSLPKFASNSQTIHLEETATFTDANHTLGNFPDIKGSNGLKASVSGDNLTITPTQAGTGTVTLSNDGISETDGTANSGGVHVWFTNNPDGTAGQNLIYSEHQPNLQAQVTVKIIPAASLKVTKLDNDTKQLIVGAVFEGLNKDGQVVTKDADGNSLPNGGKFTTGADGTLVVNNLMADPENAVGGAADTIVTLREVSVPAPYTLSNNLSSVVDSDGKPKAPSTDLPVALVAGTTASNPTGVTFADKMQVEAIQVQKTATLNGQSVKAFPNGNYSLKDAEFTVRDDTKGTVLGKLYTDESGLADLSALIKTGDSHQSATQYQALLNQLLANGDTYSVQETAAPDGLACDWNGGKAQTFKLMDTGDDSQLINPNVENPTGKNTDTPITVSTTLTKEDADTKSGKTQGAGLLQGTKETLFYKVDVKDSSGKVLHKAGSPVAWNDGFAESPITATSGKKVNDTTVTLEVVGGVNTVGVKNLPLTSDSAQDGYYWAETDEKGNKTPGYGYTDNTASFDVASGEGNDGTGLSSGMSVITGTDTNLTQDEHVLTLGLEFTKALGDSGSLTGENGAEFTITPTDGTTKVVLDGLEGQNSKATSGEAKGADGYTVAGLTSFKFPIGNWKIHQTVVPTGTKAVQDMLVSFTPKVSKEGAPQTYRLSIQWADGTSIYTKTFQADDFTDGNNNLINLNLGTLTDNKLTPPTITTQAKDAKDGDQKLGVGEVTGEDDSVIKDLPAGDYTEVTRWVDSKTGAALVVNGKAVTTTKDFTSKGTGEDHVTTNVVFSDVGLQGSAMTAEESVYPKGKVSGTPIVSETHYQENQPQTLSVEKVSGSTQVESKTIAPESKASYMDDYKAEGLEVGQSYTVKVPSVWDATSGQEVAASDEVTFTATASTMTVKVPVMLDSSKLSGHDLVTFEDLYWNDTTTKKPVLLVKNHDKNAPTETVHVNLPVDTPSTPQNIVNSVANATLPHTGDSASWLPTGIGLALLGLLAFLKRQTLVRFFLVFKAKWGR